MIKTSKRCSNCNKVIPALSTFLKVDPTWPKQMLDDGMYFCTPTCFLSYCHVEIIDPKMEKIA